MEKWTKAVKIRVIYGRCQFLGKVMRRCWKLGHSLLTHESVFHMMWFIFPSITVLQLINDMQYLVDQRDGRMRTWELEVAMLTYTV
jgi:hypothetical protein